MLVSITNSVKSESKMIFRLKAITLRRLRMTLPDCVKVSWPIGDGASDQIVSLSHQSCREYLHCPDRLKLKLDGIYRSLMTPTLKGVVASWKRSSDAIQGGAHRDAESSQSQHLGLGNRCYLRLLISDFNTVTPLHTAVSHGHLEMIGLLLEFGASKEAVDGMGETPYDWATRAGQVESLKLLEGRETGARNDSPVSSVSREPVVWTRRVPYFPNFYGRRSGMDSSIVIGVEGEGKSVTIG